MKGRYEIIRSNPYKDSRGELRKVFKKAMLGVGENIEEIYLLYTKKDSIRGNHYHKQNIEFFAVVSGRATIAVKDLLTGNYEVFRISAEDNIVLKIPENVAHGFRNDEEEELIILAAASRQYDPEDTDTYVFRLF